MKLLWTTESINRLSEIEEYISRDNAERAVEFVSNLIDHADVLLKNPKIGRKVPELSNDQIREIIYKNYRIVYRIQPDHIEILTVFESHRLFRQDEI